MSITGRSKPGASFTRTLAALRWLCGVATMPSRLPSQAASASRSSGVPGGKSEAKRSWISWRASAAEAGQVLEYCTSTATSTSNPAPSIRAPISTG